MIPSLPGKALRTVLTSRGLPSDLTCVLKAEPGKLDIKDANLVTFLFISLQAEPLFKLGIIIEVRVDSMLFTTSFKNAQRHDDLMHCNGTCHDKGNVYQVNVHQCS